jgi:exonuclease SbcC
MFIEAIHLKNFKRFPDAKIDFLNGITGIVGSNGTGKSSIVEAIFFALYGVADKSINPDHILSAFAKEGERCGIYLRFNQQGNLCEIVRTFSKKKTIFHSVSLKVNGRERASGVTQVEAEIRKIIGMGPVDFRNTVYAAQKDLMTLLDLTPGKRKEWFLRALGIDYLNKGSQEILKAEADAKEKEAGLLQGELAVLSRQDPTEIDQTRQELTCLIEKISGMKVQENITTTTYKERSGELSDYRLKEVGLGKLIDQDEYLQKEIRTLKGRVESLTVQLASLVIDETLLQHLEETVKEIPQVREEIEAYRTKKARFDNLVIETTAVIREQDGIKVRIAKIDAKIHESATGEADLASLTEKVNTTLRKDLNKKPEDSVAEAQKDATEKAAILNTEIRACKAEQNRIRKALESIRAIGPEGTCPTCLQKMGDHFGVVEKEYLSVLDAETTKEHDLGCRLDDALHETVMIADLKPTMDRIREIRIALGYRETWLDEHRHLTQDLLDTTKKVESLIGESDAIGYNEEDHLVCKQRLVEMEAAQKKHTDLMKQDTARAGMKANIAELNSQVTTKTVALEEVKAKIDANPLDLTAGPRLTHEVEELDIALKTIGRDIATETERERSLTQKVKDLEIAADRVGMVRTNLASLKTEIEILKLTRSAIADYVVYVMQVVRARLETEVSSIIAEITGGKYDRILIDEDFNLLVRDQEREYAVDRFSGGEQDDIAVALRIALSRYLAELHQVHESTLLIFDEIFGSQDEERRANLLTALRSQESRFPQIILISHIAEIQGEFENTLLVQGNGPVSMVRAGSMGDTEIDGGISLF